MSSTIFAVYTGIAPDFPATDQNPAATRYLVAGRYVDADTEPTPAELSAALISLGDVTAGNLLKVTDGGGIVAAVPGEDYMQPGAASGSGLNGGEF